MNNVDRDIQRKLRTLRHAERIGKESEAGIRLSGVPDGALPILKERGIRFRRCA